jgi:hypothetical protein
MPNANEVVLNYGHVITLHARKTTKLVVKAAYTFPRSAMVKVKAKRGVGRPDGVYHKITGEIKVKVIDQIVHEGKLVLLSACALPSLGATGRSTPGC